MADVRLARLLRRKEVALLLDAAAAGRALAVLDPQGALLAGAAQPDPPIAVHRPDGAALGAVAGPGAEAAAPALAALAALEIERRQLADEVLGLYREVNLLYALAQTLARAEDRADLTRLVLGEATRLVPADDCEVVVVDGVPPPHLTRARIDAEGGGAVLVAPLALGDVQRGAVVLRRRDRAFSAADLKLIGAVAAQAASVLERILAEEGLHRQIQELRIEIDEVRAARQVAEITETDYFQELRRRAAELRFDA